ncbi:RNA-directed DNA polymerase, eukaryota [Artemisia annua]|uniref:RNA-directed DNA polymerase, eukaryota n=1 Tax=Artemisia annua TaxID=35608 RepID=A0A2U1KI90_ARTAN|nr:RNA-directed DNA polymerase, eukaryota [Artemisia annua]
MNGGFGNANFSVSGISPWSRILAAVSRLISKQVIPSTFLQKRVGNGSNTRFWDDVWIDNQLLPTRFPRLYALETCKDANISDRWPATGWSWSWRRIMRGGIEQSQLSELTSLLVNFSCSEDRDRWWWSLDPQQLFSVKSTRCWIDKVVLPSSPAPTRWNKLVPRKVNILVWRVLLDQIPTRLNLLNRGMDIPCTLCPICSLETESINHIFSSCEVAARTWNAIEVWLQIPDLGMHSIMDIFAWLESSNMIAVDTKVGQGFA